MRRRKINAFSLSFLDCICCGLGAVILLFVIVNAKSAIRRDTVTSDLQGEVSRWERLVLESKKDLIKASNTWEKTEEKRVKLQGLSKQVIHIIKDRKEELANAQKDTLASKAHLNQLKADVKSLEKDVKRLEAGSREDDEYGSKLRKFPGVGDRQYLTDLKLGGNRIFILVDTSASMLDDTVLGIILKRNLADTQKIKSKKWQQAVATIQWLTANLPVTSKFQIYTFNETAAPVLKGTEKTWLEGTDVESLNRLVARLQQVIPQNGTSLLNAFKAAKEMQPPPDNLFLLTDSLPTMGAGKSWRSKVSGKRRVALFNDAMEHLPSGVPLNVILYPMEGDPLAAVLFWRLAAVTKGSFFCPSKDWP
jgi:von Willebrand factor type A domain